MAKQYEGLSFYRRKKKISSKLVNEIFGWIISILITVFLGCTLVRLFGMTATVVGSSMEPGLLSGQEVLVDRFSYVLGKPRAGDVVVFLPNGNENSHYYTKRIVAVGGDTVLISGGKLYVNGEVSEYCSEYIADPGIAEIEITLDLGTYFVLGDYPSESEDSRSTALGPVEKDDIAGRAWFKLPYENNKMGFIK